MAETVLCGCIRIDEFHDSWRERLQSHRENLKSVVPFVYLSVPGETNTEAIPDLPIIRDRSDRVLSDWVAVYSVLKVLRQPVLMTSTAREPLNPSLLSDLVDHWDMCSERLSGVFLRGTKKFRRYPGLFASPLLSMFRNQDSNSKLSLDEIVRREPARCIDTPKSR